MGQYYRAIILDATSKYVQTWVPSALVKLMEHSYIGDDCLKKMEALICPDGVFGKSRVVWCGDYADDKSIYEACTDLKMSRPWTADMPSHPYLVNHCKKLYVEIARKFEGSQGIHPLPILTAEGNGRGGGDYLGKQMELVGTWARDFISVEKDIPAGYEELVCEFRDEELE